MGDSVKRYGEVNEGSEENSGGLVGLADEVFQQLQDVFSTPLWPETEEVGR